MIDLSSTIADALQTRIVEEDGKMHIGRFQDCTPILDYAKRQHNEGHHGSADMKHAARIPNVIIERYCNDHGIEFSECMNNRDHMRAMLNDPSLSGFRIWKGNV